MIQSRFRKLSDELRLKFGCRVQRIAIDAGFTCPNRDGSRGSGGCVFCSGRGSAVDWLDRNLSVTEQILEGKDGMKRRYCAKKFIAYFQPFSNTYSNVGTLERLYSEAISNVDVVGLMIGTRPDCINDEIADMLSIFNKKTWLWVELGLQSSHNRTLKAINRGHSVQEFEQSVITLKKRGVRVCAHVILGLPGETHDDMMQTARYLSRVNVDGVKIHHLHVIEDTPLAQMYRNGEIKTLSSCDYVQLAADFLERLPPETVIHRVVGDGGNSLIAPKWGERPFEVIIKIEDELARRGTQQGSRYA